MNIRVSLAGWVLLDLTILQREYVDEESFESGYTGIAAVADASEPVGFRMPPSMEPLYDDE